jgi:hypothetical protein
MSVTRKKGTTIRQEAVYVRILVPSNSAWATCTKRLAEDALVIVIEAMCVNGAAPITSEELDKRELAFVEDFYKLLRAAYFNIISREDWETAQDENFTVRTCSESSRFLENWSFRLSPFFSQSPGWPKGRVLKWLEQRIVERRKDLKPAPLVQRR